MSSREQDTQFVTVSPTSLSANDRTSRRVVASSLWKGFSMDNVVVNRSINEPLNIDSEQDDDTSTDGSDSETKPLFRNPPTVLDEEQSRLLQRRGQIELVSTAETNHIRCDCHESPKPADRTARNKLMIACVVVLLFLIGEVIGWSWCS